MDRSVSTDYGGLCFVVAGLAPACLVDASALVENLRFCTAFVSSVGIDKVLHKSQNVQPRSMSLPMTFFNRCDSPVFALLVKTFVGGL